MNNQITVIGYIGNAPVPKQFDSGSRVVEFSVAVREYSDPNEDKTLWLDVQAWNGIGDRVTKTITKGREVLINGRLTVQSFKRNDGTEVIKPVIKLNSFHLCGKKPQPTQNDQVTEEAPPN